MFDRILDSFDNLPFKENRINDLRNFIYILKKYVNNNDEIFLFGSYAKGLIKESSDYDILIIKNDDISLKEIYKQKLNIFSKLCEECDQEFDLKVYSKEQFLKALNRNSFFEVEINKYMLNITNTR